MELLLDAWTQQRDADFARLTAAPPSGTICSTAELRTALTTIDAMAEQYLPDRAVQALLSAAERAADVGGAVTTAAIAQVGSAAL